MSIKKNVKSDFTPPLIDNPGYYQEPFRNQFHFSPETGWMNDPNGMVYYDGEYHLFYQHNPYGINHEFMHWGHAVSKDLVHWEHLPIALEPDEYGTIFSGSAVIDYENTAGFGKEAMIAIFTHDDSEGEKQSIAYSLNKGRTWEKYKGNPVMPDSPTEDWRDPNVFWHKESRKWVMSLAAEDKIMFYTSENLKDWELTSEFGPAGATGGVWECPALVKLPIDGDPDNTKWLLVVNNNPGGPVGGSGAQYFVGHFDGKTFTNENSSDQVLWGDFGADFYAAVEWNGIEGNNGEKYWIGWMNNWEYAEEIPTSTWTSSMSLPRKIELTNTKEGIRLQQTPVSLEYIRESSQKVSYTDETISSESKPLSELQNDEVELVAEFDISNASAKEFGFKVRKRDEDEYTKIGYDVSSNKLFVNRTNSDSFEYGDEVEKRHEGTLYATDNNIVKMHILMDQSSIEVFGNDGKTVITDRIFPEYSSKGFEIYSNDGDTTLKSLDLFPLKSIWKDKSCFRSNLTGWKTVSGRWADTIYGKQGQSDGNSFIMTKETGHNFMYEANITIRDSEYSDNLLGSGALVFRSDITGEYSYAVNIDVKHNEIKLIKFLNGKGYDITKYNGYGNLNLKANKEYHLKVVIFDDNIKVFLDDRLVIKTQDQAYDKGYFGLNVWDSTVTFNNVKVQYIKLAHS